MTAKTKILNVRIPEDEKEKFRQVLPKLKEELKNLVNSGQLSNLELATPEDSDLYRYVAGFRVDLATYLKLKELAESNGVSMSKIIRYIFYKLVQQSS